MTTDTPAPATTSTPTASEITNMTDKELKSHANLLRQQLNHLNTEIRKSIEEVKLHRESSNKLREKRDALNSTVKECVNRANVCKKSRDEINQKISDLKKVRAELQTQIALHRDEMKQAKEKRDSLNAIAKMRTTSLEKAYAHELYVFTNADIPLTHEKDSFIRSKELVLRLNASREADAIHAELTSVYKVVRELRKKTDAVHLDIQRLADESQQYHDELFSVYNKLDGIRKEANLYHAQLKDEYRIIGPLSKSIDVRKASVERTRKELSECLDLQKGGRPKEGDSDEHAAALTKLNTTGRMSMEEFRILMKHKDIAFD